MKGKALPYDFDSRIPFYIKGPDIPRGETRDQIVLNIDLAPTLMDLAGYSKENERNLDGTSIMEVARGRVELQWRNYFLIERGRFPQKKLNPKPDKQMYIRDVCQKELFRNPGDAPCAPKQTHYCFEEDGEEGRRWVIAKCERDAKTRQGKRLESGECYCHGRLKKQKRKEKANRLCRESVRSTYGYRTKRTVYHPQYHPISIDCLTDTDCTCPKEKVPVRNTAKSRPKSESGRMLSEMRSKMKTETKTYNQRKEFFKNIRNYHNNGRRSHGCKTRGLACFE